MIASRAAENGGPRTAERDQVQHASMASVPGGYGHRDHVQVHDVGARAADMAGIARVLEATIPREPVVGLFSVLRFLRLAVRYDPSAVRAGGSPRSAVTHRVGVRRFAAQKRAALAAHQSQVNGTGRSARVY